MVRNSTSIPSSIVINVGWAVVLTNYDTNSHSDSSNPYPSDNGLVRFKSQLLNQDYSFVFDIPGTFGYHDDLNPFSFKGTVVVK